MPLFLLDDQTEFPPAEMAEKEGMLAVGGDLSPQRLIQAYREGIFPWYEEGQPIIWWAPDPRFVLFLDEFHVSRTTQRIVRQKKFTLTFDRDFASVIEACRQPRRGPQEGTWITAEMAAAYRRLHELGLAHSVETWRGESLAGGLYGVSLGRCFFGESMFSRVSEASKVALAVLTARLAGRGFRFVDCQVYSRNLEAFGARLISRDEYHRLLKSELEHPDLTGNWGEWL